MNLANTARAARTALTPAEAMLWTILRSSPLDSWHFRRQVAFKPLYIADFASHTARLVVEADGPSHDLTVVTDEVRTAWFAARGYPVIRFTNAVILGDRQSAWREICARVPVCGPPPRSR